MNLNIDVKTQVIERNINNLCVYIKKYGFELTLVTKGIRILSDFIDKIDLEDYFIYDTRSNNLDTLYKKNKKVIAHLDMDFTFSNNKRVIVNRLQDLNVAFNIEDCFPYLYFDLGEKRLGLEISDYPIICDYIKKTNKEYGLMFNYGCFYHDNPKEFFQRINNLTKRMLIDNSLLKNVSLGGSACIPFLSQFNRYQNIKTELRLGESSFYGTIPGDINIENLDLETGGIVFRAKILKKQSPLLLSNFGYNHIDKSDLINSHLNIIEQASEYSLIKTNIEVSSNTGEINIPLNYRAGSKLVANNDVKWNFY